MASYRFEVAVTRARCYGRAPAGDAASGAMLKPTMLISASILGLGQSPSAFGQTLALLITFLGIGVIANVLIVYVVGQVLAERRQNRERQQRHGH